MNSNIDPLEQRVRRVFAKAADTFDAYLMKDWTTQAHHDLYPGARLVDEHPEELAYQGLYGQDRPGNGW